MPRTTSNVIEAVPELLWGKSGECTFAGALSAATSVTDHPVSFVRLMGVTSLAFRTRWFQGPGPEWCPSSPVGEFPEEIQAAREATGWELKVLEAPLGPQAEDLMRSVDEGLPALAYGTSMNVGVVAGYEDDGKTVLMRDYGTRGDWLRKPVDALEMFALLLGRQSNPMPDKDAAKKALATAVRNWSRRHDPAENEERGYWFGKLALQRWRDDIGSVEKLDEKQRQNLFFVSWWCYDSLVDARQAAAAYLKRVRLDFEGPAREAIGRAAELYLQEAEKVLGPAFEYGDAFLSPVFGHTLAEWTAEVRQHEREVLGEAIAIEEKAITQLKLAIG